MFLESIEYTATLIDYISRQIDLPVASVATTLGEKNISNLCHNAPMNRLLPISQIAREVISDNYLTSKSWQDSNVENLTFGKDIAALVDSKTPDKHKYVAVLYGLLLDIRQE